MAIPAIRFKPFDEETNLAIADFEDIQTNDIFNSPNAALQEVSEGLQGLLNQAKPDLGKLKSLQDDLVRATTDIFSTVKDISGMIPKDIEKTIADMLPDNPMVQNMFKQLSGECKKNSLGKKHNIRPFKDRNNCNSGNGKCDKSQVSGLLGKLTGGALGAANSTIGLLNNSLNSLISLANLGYDIGLCKVFQALGNGLPNDLLGKAGAVLMGQMAGIGNTSAIIDIAGQMSGLSPLLQLPGAIGKAVQTFNTKGLNLSGVGGLMGFADRFTGGMEIVKDNWMKSPGGLNSIADMGDDYNAEWGGVLESKAHFGDLVDIENLDELGENPFAEMSGAYSSLNKFGNVTNELVTNDEDLFAGLDESWYGELEETDVAGMFDGLGEENSSEIDDFF